MYGFNHRAEKQQQTVATVAFAVRPCDAATVTAAHKDIMGWCGNEEPRNPAYSALNKVC